MHQQTTTNQACVDPRRSNRPAHVKNLDDSLSLMDYIEHARVRRVKHCSTYVEPSRSASNELLPAWAYSRNPACLVTSRYVWSAICRIRSPIFTGKWLNDGVHLVTGSSSGEISLWNPLTFTQELSFPGHESSIRTISISHDGDWIISADHNGQVKYWQTNLNFAFVLQAHQDPIRDSSFSPTDAKFATCSDDGLIKVWDFERGESDCIMQGHGTDVKCIDWHPFKGVILSGSKDCQQPIMLWDPRSASSLCTIHIHKNAIMNIKWNDSGNHFASASKDKTIKIFDIRAMKEVQTLRGHKKEVYHVSWNPANDRFLASSGVDGSIYFWVVGDEKEAGSMDNAHDGVIWEVSWNPNGHILASVSNDHTSKIWIRNNPGDTMLDKYNLSVFPTASCEEEVEKILSATGGRDNDVDNNTKPEQAGPLPSVRSRADGIRLGLLPIDYPEGSCYLFRCHDHKNFACSFVKQKNAKPLDNNDLQSNQSQDATPEQQVPSVYDVEKEDAFMYGNGGTFFDAEGEQDERTEEREDEEESIPAQFPPVPKTLNYINPVTYMEIMQLVQENKGTKFSNTFSERDKYLDDRHKLLKYGNEGRMFERRRHSPRINILR